MSTPTQYVNTSASAFSLIKLDPNGREKRERVRGHGKFSITDVEQEINEGRIANPARNPFHNGMFVEASAYTDVLSTVDDDHAISEQELADLVAGDVDALKAGLASIDTPVTLERLLTLSRQAASGAHVTAVQDRLAELAEDTPEPRAIVGANGPIPQSVSAFDEPKRFDPSGPAPAPEKVDYYTKAMQPQAPTAFKPMTG